ncbi:MAG: hypothetical protein ACK5QT_10365 [Oligoflexia bacterium]
MQKQKWILAVVAVVGLVSTSGASASNVWGKAPSGEMPMTQVPGQARVCHRQVAAKALAQLSTGQVASIKKARSGAAIR